MLPLLWKEYRNNFALVMFGLGLLFVPILIVPILVYSVAQSTIPPEEVAKAGPEMRTAIAVGFYIGALISLVLSQFTLLCFGGQVISGERSSQTSEFLFYLPPSRKTIVVTKLIFCLLVAAAIWLVCWPIIEIAERGFDIQARAMQLENSWLAEIAAAGLILFGCSWMSSARAESPVLAMGMGALAAILVAVLLQLLAARFDLKFEINGINMTRVIVFSVIGVVGIVAGCILFTKRVEP